MAQANPEDGDAAGERLDHLHRDAGIARRAGTRRDDQMSCSEALRLIDGDRIVAAYVHVCTQHHEGLHQVVGERVVVVDQQHLRPHAHNPSAAIESALPSTALFAMTSSYSAFGRLSATMPPPAW